jgi:hypothetical protein
LERLDGMERNNWTLSLGIIGRFHGNTQKAPPIIAELGRQGWCQVVANLAQGTKDLPVRVLAEELGQFTQSRLLFLQHLLHQQPGQ